MTRPYHHGDLKNTLLRIARQHLAAYGGDRLSLREVALEAGVSHAAAYRHFPDKRSLLAELATQGFQELVPPDLAAAIDNGTQDAHALLLRYGLAYVAFGQHNPQLLQLMFGAQLSGGEPLPQLASASEATYARLMTIIVNGQSSGRFVDAPAADVALSCWAMVHGLATLLADQRAPAPDDAGVNAAAQRSLVFFTRSLLAQAA